MFLKLIWGTGQKKATILEIKDVISLTNCQYCVIFASDAGSPGSSCLLLIVRRAGKIASGEKVVIFCQKERFEVFSLYTSTDKCTSPSLSADTNKWYQTNTQSVTNKFGMWLVTIAMSSLGRDVSLSRAPALHSLNKKQRVTVKPTQPGPPNDF